MREQKFRFWDKHNKIWVGPYTLKQLADEDQFSSDREWMPICSGWEWFECVEYIGHKDARGNEVYEGDIVRAVLSDDNGSRVEEVFEEVQYDGGLLCPFFMRVNFEEDWWKDSLVDGFEVIGNIYEHPELLKR